MKTYEEMARDVLRRRDEELSSITQASQLQSQINPPPEVVYPASAKKRGKLGLLPKIAIPCAAAVLVGTVGLTVWKNVKKDNSRGKYINPYVYEDEPGTPEYSDGVVFQIAAEQPESIYKGGKTEIYINEVEDWNSYSFPLLLEEDFSPIEYNINNYYGMEFDRLSKVYPEWESSHEPFGIYAHDEFNAEVASHRIIYTINRIDYTTDNNGSVCVVASLIEKYDAATAENAKPSIINGFDAMIYKSTRIGNYAADIDMGSARVTISALDIDEEEFLNILDVYTAPDKGSDDNNNHNQTMEDKIVVLDNRPDFILREVDYELAYTDYSTTLGVIWRRYSAEELNAVYGLNFTCFNELHPEWRKNYNELEFGVIYKTDNHTIGGDIPQNREILEARNRINYRISEDSHITIITRLGEIPDGDVEHSVINGYDAVIFRESPQHNIFGAIIDMDGTLICATMEIVTSGEEFVDLLREYTSEAAKYVKPESITPSEFTVFNAVDPFDDYITYEVSWDVDSCWWKNTSAGYREELSKEITDAETTVGYLKDFFGTDRLPIDEQYKGNFMRRKDDGEFNCYTAVCAKVYSPVDGKVVATCDGWYNRSLGNSVAVEFGDGKIFIIGHLGEINVEVGDTVTAGQALGVCGSSGHVYFEEPPVLTLIMMVKTDD